MNALSEIWMVALRDMRERSRSRAFRASLLVMVLITVGVVLLPALLDSGGDSRNVGLAGPVPGDLTRTIVDQGEAVGMTISVTEYSTTADAEEAVRNGDIDVLVLGDQRLEWRTRVDDQLQAIVAGAIQLMAVRDRAAAAGIGEGDLVALLAPVQIENVELGGVPGRSSDDEAAVMVMTVLLFGAISMYGTFVLSGVVEEKANRVVEVLLSRIRPRSLLAGKVIGIGLLGLFQFSVTAVAALLAVRTFDVIDVPAVRVSVLVWAVVWFVVGYSLYAMALGALGSLASRSEDSSSVSGPVLVVLITAYWASFFSLGSPDSGWARVVSYFPATAPLAMPGRIAMATAAWWEPFVALGLALGSVVALAQLGGWVYERAVLHSGAALSLRDLWRRTRRPGTELAHGPAGEGR